MTLRVAHLFSSPITDAGNPEIVGPDEWNDDHVIQMSTARVLGRTTAGGE